MRVWVWLATLAVFLPPCLRLGKLRCTRVSFGARGEWVKGFLLAGSLVFLPRGSLTYALLTVRSPYPTVSLWSPVASRGHHGGHGASGKIAVRICPAEKAG